MRGRLLRRDLRTHCAWRGIPPKVEPHYYLVLEQRGERLDAAKPLVVLSRPDTVGGQEFDAVICVGLEQGVIPARIDGNAALAAALEQQALREMYLAFTRARYRLAVVLPNAAAPTPVLQSAISDGLLKIGA